MHELAESIKHLATSAENVGFWWNVREMFIYAVAWLGGTSIIGIIGFTIIRCVRITEDKEK